jgi:5-methylcytosine-specific restriction endonuclease McrA
VNKLHSIILDKPQDAKPKVKISHSLRRNVWNMYIGEDIGSSTCPCCDITKITQLNFDCGHVKPESSGGQTNINNLRPICGSCNTSMGQFHMVSFMKSHGVLNTEIVTRLKL